MLEFEKIRVDILKERWNSELSYLTQNDPTNGRIPYIEQLLEELKNNKKYKKFDYRDELFTEIDKYTYKKQWHLLPQFHKIVKLKEYFTNQYGDGEFQNIVLYEIIKIIENGGFNTKALVVYSSKNECIESIPGLKIDIENRTYELKNK